MSPLTATLQLVFTQQCLSTILCTPLLPFEQDSGYYRSRPHLPYGLALVVAQANIA
jgi:hypothetical protein